MKKRLVITAISLVLVVTVVVFGRLFLVQTIEESYAAHPVNIEAGEVAAVSGIIHGKSILGIDEKRAMHAIESAYPDNSVAVTGIERVFPNKVIIHVKERVPIAVVATASSNMYALADVDFQYNKIVPEHEISNYILISGIEVNTTFNTPVFASIRQVFLAFINLGTPDYALPLLITEVNYSRDNISVILRDGHTISVETNTNDIIAEITYLYLLISPH